MNASTVLYCSTTAFIFTNEDVCIDTSACLADSLQHCSINTYYTTLPTILYLCCFLNNPIHLSIFFVLLSSSLFFYYKKTICLSFKTEHMIVIVAMMVTIVVPLMIVMDVPLLWHLLLQPRNVFKRILLTNKYRTKKKLPAKEPPVKIRPPPKNPRTKKRSSEENYSFFH